MEMGLPISLGPLLPYLSRHWHSGVPFLKSVIILCLIVCKALSHVILHLLTTADKEEKIPHFTEQEPYTRLLPVRHTADLDSNPGFLTPSLLLSSQYVSWTWFALYCWAALCITAQFPHSSVGRDARAPEAGCRAWIPGSHHPSRCPVCSHCVPPPCL